MKLSFDCACGRRIIWTPVGVVSETPVPRWVACPGEHVETTDGRWMRLENLLLFNDKPSVTGWQFCHSPHRRRAGSEFACGNIWERQEA